MSYLTIRHAGSSVRRIVYSRFGKSLNKSGELMTKTVHMRLRLERRKARVPAKDVATKLGVDSGALSRFELYGTPLPYGLTVDDYRAALSRLVASMSRREAESEVRK